MCAVRNLFADFVCNLAKVYEVTGNVNHLRRGVGAKARHFDAATLVGDGIDGVNEILITGDEHGCIVASGQRKHVHGDLNIEIRFARAVVKGLQFFLHDAETVAPHPEQKTLLTFSADINAGVEESSEQAAIAEQDT